MTSKTSQRACSLIALAAIAALGSTSAQAQDSSYYYYGFGIGQARATVDDGAIAAALAGSGLTINAVSHEERESTYKLFGGYQFNRHIGLELGYFDMGRFGFRATTTPPGTLSGNFRVQGGNLDLVGTLPLAGDLSALARIGMQYAGGCHQYQPVRPRNQCQGWPRFAIRIQPGLFVAW